MTVTGLRPLFDLGRWDDVLAGAEQLDRAPAPQQGFYDVLPRVLRARVLLLRGDASAAISALPEVISPDGGPQTRLPQLTLAAQIAVATGDRDGGNTLLTEALAAAHEGEWFAAMDAPDLIRLCAAAGRLADLDHLIAACMQRPVRHRAARDSAEAVRCELDGALASAAERYADAAAQWHRHGSVLEERTPYWDRPGAGPPPAATPWASHGRPSSFSSGSAPPSWRGSRTAVPTVVADTG